MIGKNDNLDNLRHSAAHLLAAAVLNLWPEAKHAIGPSIEDGFYYDFDFGGEKISKDDLAKIEKKMQEIVKDWGLFEKMEVSAKEARERFKDNPYKQELIDEFEKEGEKTTLYKSGEFVDLCRGGHTKNPEKDLKHFKLLSVAGAYWRGDEKKPMLTRIYGTVFPSKRQLEAYLKKRELAEELNHRKLGKELELFELYPETIGPGLPVWLPKGYVMRRIIEDYMLNLERKYGYEHVLTPHISRDKLFEISGHLDFYKESMYSPMEIDDQEYYLKPMNCPAAMMIFNRKTRSYNDLPIKLGELGTVYRYEKSGELHGLQRVRGFTQNDAHLFCSKDQLPDLLEETLEMMQIFFKDVGFKDYKYVLATSDPEDEKFKKVGTPQGWKKAEDTLKEVLEKNNLEYEIDEGEAAFYGPKVDVLAVNVYGKSDAISTVQVDFNLPERFGVSFVNKKGEKEEPLVIHRALVGSFERFFAFLIEHHKGAFPVWFSPVQVKVLPVADKNNSYALKVKEKLEDEEVRVEVMQESETLNNKIRKAQEQKVPYMLIVGDKEEEKSTVSLRLRSEEDLGNIKLDKFIERVKQRIEDKSLEL